MHEADNEERSGDEGIGFTLPDEHVLRLPPPLLLDVRVAEDFTDCDVVVVVVIFLLLAAVMLILGERDDEGAEDVIPEDFGMNAHDDDEELTADLIG